MNSVGDIDRLPPGLRLRLPVVADDDPRDPVGGRADRARPSLQRRESAQRLHQRIGLFSQLVHSSSHLLLERRPSCRTRGNPSSHIPSQFYIIIIIIVITNYWNCSETALRIVRKKAVSPKAQTRTNKAKYISVREAAARYRIKPKRTHRL